MNRKVNQNARARRFDRFRKKFFQEGVDISVHVCYTVFVSEGAEPTQGKSQGDM